MAETSTIFGFMKYVSATDILSDFKKTVDSHFVNSLRYRKISFYFLRSFDYVHQRTIKKAFDSINVRTSFNRINGIC